MPDGDIIFCQCRERERVTPIRSNSSILNIDIQYYAREYIIMTERVLEALPETITT